MDRVIIFSSDGHATARMEDYRPYLPVALRDDFDAFCAVYAEKGSKNFEPRALRVRLDPELVEQWERDYYAPGRLDGYWSMERRLKEMEREGITGEVLFPDFGLPFELYGSKTQQAAEGLPPLTPELIDVQNRAYNRWVADFVSQAPERFAGMALVSLGDIDAALSEIRWAREAGLRGIVLPHFSEAEPLYHPRFEPVWSLLEDLDMIANSHSVMSSTYDQVPALTSPPHASCITQVFAPRMMFYCRQLLTHFIWGGVYERHPRLKTVFTEMQTDWVLSTLALMDYSYEGGSFVRRDSNEALSMAPSEYFRRQAFMGSSLFSRAEVEARGRIGIDNMLLGMDYPHHEGCLLVGVRDYLSQTLGHARVPEAEARKMLGLNAVSLFGMDVDALQAIANEHGLTVDEALAVPEQECTERGDILRPLV